jgi:hypothetical protein
VLKTARGLGIDQTLDIVMEQARAQRLVLVAFPPDVEQLGHRLSPAVALLAFTHPFDRIAAAKCKQRISSEMVNALLPIYLVTVLGTSTLTVGFIHAARLSQRTTSSRIPKPACHGAAGILIGYPNGPRCLWCRAGWIVVRGLEASTPILRERNDIAAVLAGRFAAGTPGGRRTPR